MLFLRSSWLLLLAVFPFPPSTELEVVESGSGYRGWSPEFDLLSSALRLLDSLRQRRRMEISVGDGRFGCAGWELRPCAKVIVVAEADVVDVLDGQVTMVVEPPEEATASFGLWPWGWLIMSMQFLLEAALAGEITFCELPPLFETLSSSEAEPAPPPPATAVGLSWLILRLVEPELPSIWISEVVMEDTWPRCGLLLLSLRWKKLPPVLLLDLLLVVRKDRC